MKKRLIGAAVLVSLAVIFVPMLIEKRPPDAADELALPELPAKLPEPPAFESKLLRDEIPAPTPLPPLATSEESPSETGVVEPPSEQTNDAPETAVAAAPRTPFEPPVKLQSWVIQVGTFRSIENARRLVAKLREAGFDTLDPEQVKLQGRVLYRVRVGPEVDRERAVRLLPKVKQVSGLAAKVRTYP